MKGGYILLDCKGIDLHSLSDVTVAGFYDRVKEAISTRKPIYGYNLVETDFLTEVVHPVSPVSLYVTAHNVSGAGGTTSTYYDLCAFKWHIIVKPDNSVMVIDEIADEIESAASDGEGAD